MNLKSIKDSAVNKSYKSTAQNKVIDKGCPVEAIVKFFENAPSDQTTELELKVNGSKYHILARPHKVQTIKAYKDGKLIYVEEDNIADLDLEGVAKTILRDNPKEISDASVTGVSSLLRMLTEKRVTDSAEIEDCDDLVLAASVTGMSDPDIILTWEGTASKEEKEALMEAISEEFDQPESLDESVYDYITHQHLDPAEIVVFLNNYLSTEKRKELCASLLNITDSAEEYTCLETLMNDYPVTSETIMKQFSVWASSGKVQEFLRDFAKSHDIEELQSLDSVLDLDITTQQLAEELNQWLDSDTKKEFIKDLFKDLDLDRVEDSVDETLNSYRKLKQLFEENNAEGFAEFWAGCSEECKKVIIENSEDDPQEFKDWLK